MCGIAGIRRLDGAPVDPQTLRRMAGELRHRGPDDMGFWVEGACGFAHARLSIIDLDGSRQPMSTPDNRKHVVFNGEILNYGELRCSLPYEFRTAGDTEVLLALYEKYGPMGVTRLRGQFAYVIHDVERRETHLFRDRLGILPLFYYSDNNIFAFASEMKALLPCVRSPEVDYDSLHDYFAHRAVASPFTLIKNIRKVPQGHHIVITANGSIRSTSYWELPKESCREKVASVRAIDRVDEALNASVKDALVADVPVGLYLSGGLDSSLLTALAGRAHREQLHTFSASFADSQNDERMWARRVSNIVGTNHHEVTVTPADFLSNWAKLSWHRDGPLSEPADVAIFRLAELARNNVKVVLSGEGSDEIFGGYPKHVFANATRWAGAVPSSRALRCLERSLPPSRSRLRIAVRALSEPTYAERMRGWFAPFTVAERTQLLGGPPQRSVLEPYNLGRGDGLRRMLYADVYTWLADNLLERGDRMSMAASLETRPPFLDHRLVELAFSLPSSMKTHGRTTKWILKQVAYRYLPQSVVDRPKIGFKVPLDRWFRGGLQELAFDLLTAPSSFVGDICDRRMVRKLLDSHASGYRNEESRIWPLLSLEIWHREIINRGCLTSKVHI